MRQFSAHQSQFWGVSGKLICRPAVRSTILLTHTPWPARVAWRLDRGHVEERADPRVRRDTIVGEIDADEDVVVGDPRHFGMPNVVRFSARHDQTKRSEGALPQQVAEHGRGHGWAFSVCLLGWYTKVHLIASDLLQPFPPRRPSLRALPSVLLVVTHPPRCPPR